MNTKICITCKQELPIENFGKWARAKDGHKHYCRECATKRRRELKEERGLKVRPIYEPSPSGFKVCRKCLIERPITDFSPQKRTNDGIGSWCKECRKNLENERRRSKGIPERKRRDPTLLDEGLKECLECYQTYPLSGFRSNPRGIGGRSAYCKECERQLLLKWQRQNPRPHQKMDKRALLLHRLRQQRRRAKQRGQDTGTVTTEFMVELYNSEICAYCEELVPLPRRTADHIIPIVRGGLHDISNLTMCCSSCNSSKGNKTGEEYLKWRKVNGVYSTRK